MRRLLLIATLLTGCDGVSEWMQDGACKICRDKHLDCYWDKVKAADGSEKYQAFCLVPTPAESMK